MKRYDKEFKKQTVEMILEGGKPVTQVARELGISNKTLYYWVKQYKEDKDEAFPGSGNLKPADREWRELQKRIRDLEEENEILKKATHFFTKDRN